MSNNTLAFVVLWISVITLFSGCSGQLKTYEVNGKVVFEDGSPVHVGTVELTSRDHDIQASGDIDTDGNFTLTTYESGDGAVEGMHDAVVVQFVMVEEVNGLHGGTLGVVHPKYGSYDTAELEVEIKKNGPNEITLTVTGVSEDEMRPANHKHDHDHAHDE